MDKFGYVTASTSALFIIAGLSIFLLYFGFAPAAMFVLFGLASGIPGGAVLSLTSQAVTAENRGLGLGIFWTLHYTGMAITPAGAGWLRDVAGNPGAPLLLVSALMVLSVLAILLFRLLQSHWPIAKG
jgi:MFS family permease